MSLEKQAEDKMKQSIDALETALKKIRTGRAHTSLLDTIQVSYYGNPTPLNQVASVTILDNRTLSVTPWEKNLVPEIEKAIMNADLGLNPATSGDLIRVPLPALTEETRQNYIKQAKHEAEHTRIAIRNIRRDANHKAKDEAENEDLEKKLQHAIQQLTDKYIEKINGIVKHKEEELLEV